MALQPVTGVFQWKHIGQGLQSAVTQAKALGDSAGKAQSELKQLAASTKTATDAASGLTGKFKAAKDALGTAQNTAGTFLNTLSKMRIGMLAVVGVMGGFAAGALKIASGLISIQSEYSKAIREVQSIAHVGNEQMNELSKGVLDVATRFGVDAVDAAHSMYQAISAGIPSGNALEVVTDASELAIAGLATVEESIDATTGIINAWSNRWKENGKVVAGATREIGDILFKTVEIGKTRLPELSAGISTVASSARMLNVPLEDVMASVATLTKMNVSTQNSFQIMSMVMNKLMAPTSALEASIKALGYESGRAMVEQLGLHGSMKVLAKSAELTGVEIADVTGKQVNMVKAVAILGDLSDTAASDLEAIRNSAGAMGAAFEIMSASTGFSIKRIQSAIKNMKIGMGKELTDAIRPFAAWAAENLPAIFEVILSMTKVLGAALQNIAKALLPVLNASTALILGAAKKVSDFFIMISEKVDKMNLIPVLAAIATMIGVVLVMAVLTLIPPIISLGVAIWSATAPILPFIAAAVAIGVIVGVLVAVFMKFKDQIMNALMPVIIFLKEKFLEAWNNLKEGLGKIIKFLQYYIAFYVWFYKTLWNGLKSIFAVGDAVEGVGSKFAWLGPIIKVLKAYLQMLWDMWMAIFRLDPQGFADAFINFWKKVLPGDVIDTLRAGFAQIMDIFSRVREAFGALFAGDVSGAKDILAGVWEDISAGLLALKDMLIAKFEEIKAWFFNWLVNTFGAERAEQVMGFVNAVIARIQEFGQFLAAQFEIIKQYLANFIGFFQAIFSGDWSAAWDRMKAMAENIKQFILNIFTEIGNQLRAIGLGGVVDKFIQVRDAIVNVWNRAVTAIQNTIKRIRDTFNSIVKAIHDTKVKMQAKIKEIVDAVKKWVEDHKKLILTLSIPLLVVVGTIIIVGMILKKLVELWIALWTKIGEATAELAGAIVEKISGWVENIRNLFSRNTENVVDENTEMDTKTTETYTSLTTRISEMWATFCDWVGTKTEELGEWLSETWDWIADTAHAIWTWIHDNIIQRVINIARMIKAWFTTARDWLVAILVNIWKNVKAVWKAVWDRIMGFIRPLVKNVKSAFHWLGQQMKRIWDRILEAVEVAWSWIHDHIVEPVASMVRQAINFFREFQQKIAETFANVVEVVDEAITAVVNWIVDGLSHLPGAAATAIGGFGNRITHGLREVAANVRGWASRVAATFEGVQETWASMFGSRPDVPEVEEGGGEAGYVEPEATADFGPEGMDLGGAPSEGGEGGAAERERAAARPRSSSGRSRAAGQTRTAAEIMADIVQAVADAISQGLEALTTLMETPIPAKEKYMAKLDEFQAFVVEVITRFQEMFQNVNQEAEAAGPNAFFVNEDVQNILTGAEPVAQLMDLLAGGVDVITRFLDLKVPDPQTAIPPVVDFIKTAIELMKPLSTILSEEDVLAWGKVLETYNELLSMLGVGSDTISVLSEAIIATDIEARLTQVAGMLEGIARVTAPLVASAVQALGEELADQMQFTQWVAEAFAAWGNALQPVVALAVSMSDMAPLETASRMINGQMRTVIVAFDTLGLMLQGLVDTSLPYVAAMLKAYEERSQAIADLEVSKAVASTFEAWTNAFSTMVTFVNSIREFKAMDLTTVMEQIGGVLGDDGKRKGGLLQWLVDLSVGFVQGARRIAATAENVNKELGVSQTVAATFQAWAQTFAAIAQMATALVDMKEPGEQVRQAVDVLVAWIDGIARQFGEAARQAEATPELAGIAQTIYRDVGSTIQTFAGVVTAIVTMSQTANSIAPLTEKAKGRIQAAMAALYAFALALVRGPGFDLTVVPEETTKANALARDILDTISKTVEAVKGIVDVAHALDEELKPIGADILKIATDNLKLVRDAIVELALEWYDTFSEQSMMLTDALAESGHTWNEVKAAMANFSEIMGPAMDAFMKGLTKIEEFTLITDEHITVAKNNINRMLVAALQLAIEWDNGIREVFGEGIFEGRTWEELKLAIEKFLAMVSPAIDMISKAFVKVEEFTDLTDAHMLVAKNNIGKMLGAALQLAMEFDSLMTNAFINNFFFGGRTWEELQKLMDNFVAIAGPAIELIGKALGIAEAEFSQISDTVVANLKDGIRRLTIAIMELTLEFNAWLPELLSYLPVGSTINDLKLLATNFAEIAGAATDTFQGIVELNKSMAEWKELPDQQLIIDGIKRTVVSVLQAYNEALQQVGAESVIEAGKTVTAAQGIVEVIGGAFAAIKAIMENPLVDVKSMMYRSSEWTRGTRKRWLDFDATLITEGIKRMFTTIIDAVKDLPEVPELPEGLMRLMTLMERMAVVIEKINGVKIKTSNVKTFLNAVKMILGEMGLILTPAGAAASGSNQGEGGHTGGGGGWNLPRPPSQPPGPGNLAGLLTSPATIAAITAAVVAVTQAAYTTGETPGNIDLSGATAVQIVLPPGAIIPVTPPGISPVPEPEPPGRPGEPQPRNEVSFYGPNTFIQGEEATDQLITLLETGSLPTS